MCGFTVMTTNFHLCGVVEIGLIKDVIKEELLEALGTDDVTVRFWIEWSE